jgi:HK97 family phage prohead protease
MERKSYDLTLELKGEDGGEFSAYFATFNDIDHGNDRIEPGAFKNLDAFMKSGWIALNHEHARLPVGYPTSAVQDAKGLLITGRYHSTKFAQDVRTVVKERTEAGKAVKGSIGYRATDHEKVQLDGKSIRSLKGIDLKECSFVNLPMNDNADLVHSKSLISLDEIGSLIEEYKAGRVLSAANLSTMRGWASTLTDHASQINDLCNQHDPMYLMPPKSLSAEAADLHLQTLALCAKFGPFLPSPGKG